MRFNVPATGSSQQILSGGQVKQVVLQNVSAVNIYVGDSQSALDSSVDPGSGVPNYGFVLFPNSNPVVIDKLSTPLYARAAVVGGALECTVNPVC